jgi:hypothetical protein
MPAHGYSDGRDHDVRASPSSSTRPSGPIGRGRRVAQLQDSFPSLLFFSFFSFPFFSILSHVLPVLPLAYKREGLVSLWGRGFLLSRLAHTCSQVLKPPLPSSEQRGLERTYHAHQRLGKPIPLSIVCNPYHKPNTELVAQAATNWSRDILPEPVYIFASSKLTIRT